MVMKTSSLLPLFVLVSHAADVPNVDYFTDNGFGNPSTTLQHPTGEFYKGTTYLAYQIKDRMRIPTLPLTIMPTRNGLGRCWRE